MSTPCFGAPGDVSLNPRVGVFCLFPEVLEKENIVGEVVITIEMPPKRTRAELAV